ncbi:ubiquitin-protein ligase [Lithospermum erythrorhizon]|uniref:RING-type E3 ubiquitin transferase n=1 Tax=Lithospermum erythrorhizon TaxID=34254 RepID=A0AAV3RL50_LITER
MAQTTSFWCYQCNRHISISINTTSMTCPHCITTPTSRRRSLGFRRNRRSNTGENSPFNPVILLRSPQQNTGDDVSGGERLYRLYYHDGAGTGLRRLPQTMSELLLGAGFNRLLDQLSQLESNRSEKAPASKTAIESMPTVEIEACHVSAELDCPVCYEGFVIGDEAREMPCQHLYHSHCILPWLSIRNSCPICRHELNSETQIEPDSEHNQVNNNNNNNNDWGHNEPVGLSIWRLPGGGYAVGRFSGGRSGVREVPVVYTEMDGDYNINGLTRRVVWRRNRGSGVGGMGRLFGKFASVFRRFSSSSIPRSRRGWAMEEAAGMGMVRG